MYAEGSNTSQLQGKEGFPFLWPLFAAGLRWAVYTAMIMLGHISGYDIGPHWLVPVNGYAAWVVTGVGAGDGLLIFLVCVGRLEPAHPWRGA